MVRKPTREDLEDALINVRVLKNRSGPASKTITLRFDPVVLRIQPASAERTPE